MKLKYYLRGLGIGIIVTTIILVSCFSMQKPKMTDEQIIEKAAQLGMIMPEQMNATLMSLSDQVSGQWFLLLNRVTEYACTLLEETQHQQVFTNGASQLLKFPEFRDIDKAHDLMSFMVDNKEDLPVPQSDAPMQILIGPENVNDALKESSVVIASYDIGDNMRGLVGVVGPTRMDYAAVAARLSYFAESLSRMFGKKQLPEDIQ